MIPIDVARTLEGLVGLNRLVVATARIRFQMAPGTGADLGVAGASYSVLQNGVEVASGQIDANGEVSFPMPAGTPAVLRIFGTDYNLSYHTGLRAVNTLAGQQERLDILGYMSGYQLSPIGNDSPSDGRDGPRTQQSIMNFQTDQNLSIDGEAGNQTRNALQREAGG